MKARWAAVAVVLLLGLTVLVQVLEAQRLRTATAHYMQSALYQTEQVIYLDYRERLLNIFQHGDANTLYQLRHDQLHAPERFARILLQDRQFAPYVEEKGRLYFDPEALRTWRTQRAELAAAPHSRSLRDALALIPGQARPASFITYPLAAPVWPSLLWQGGLILVLLIAAIKACRLTLWVITSTVFGGMVAGGVVYLMVASIYAAPLAGWLPVVTALLGLLGGCSAGLVWRIWQRTEPRSALQLESPLAGLVCALADYLDQQRPSRRAPSAVIIALLIVLLIVLTTAALLGLASLTQALTLPLLASGIGALVIALVIACYQSGRPGGPSQAQTQRPGQAAPHVRTPEYRRALSKALSAMGKMQFKAARKLLKPMIQAYPEQMEVVRALYHVEKLWPEEATYWACATTLIQDAVRNDDYPLALMIFNDVQQHAASKSTARARLTPSDYHKVMMIFVNHGDLVKAEQSFLFLELAGDREIIKDACAVLKEEFARRGAAAKVAQYAALLVNVAN